MTHFYVKKHPRLARGSAVTITQLIVQMQFFACLILFCSTSTTSLINKAHLLCMDWSPGDQALVNVWGCGDRNLFVRFTIGPHYLVRADCKSNKQIPTTTADIPCKLVTACHEMARDRIGHDSGPVLAWNTVDVLHTERPMSAMHGGCTKPLCATWYTVYTTLYHTVPVWHTMPCHATPHCTTKYPYNTRYHTHTLPPYHAIPHIPYHTHATPHSYHPTHHIPPDHTIPHPYRTPTRTPPPPYHTTPHHTHTTQHYKPHTYNAMPMPCGFTIILRRSRSPSVGDD